MYTNNTGLPLSISVYLATDNYDYDSRENVISATSILKPTKQVILSKRIKDRTIDLSSLIASRMGSSIHDAIEKAWQKPQKALEALGLQPNTINRVKVNPSPEELTEGCIPVYMELRGEREIDGWTVSGKFDFVIDGALEDFKTTSTTNYIKQCNAEKYILQGSIYRWIFPELIKEDYMTIQYIFTDWSAIKAVQDKNYPQSRIIPQKYMLKPIKEIEHIIKHKLQELSKYMSSDQPMIPDCTEEDLWTTEPVFKYFKNPNGVRSTKNFSSYFEAHQKLLEDGSVGIIKEVKGEVRACRYCAGASICEQKDRLIMEGRLVI